MSTNSRETIGLTQFSEEELDTVLGIFLVNDFEITAKVSAWLEDFPLVQVSPGEFSSQGRNSLRGLYQIASIPNHHCVANTSHTFASLQVTRSPGVTGGLLRMGSGWWSGPAGRSGQGKTSLTAMSTPW